MNRRNFFGLLAAAPLAPLVTVGIASDGWDINRMPYLNNLHTPECILPAKLAAQIRSASLPYKGRICHVHVSARALNSQEIAHLIRS